MTTAKLEADRDTVPPAPTPPEIIRVIFENLYDARAKDTKTFYSLSLTSKLFNLEANRLLYRAVTLDNGDRCLKFLTTTRANPELASIVETFHSPLTPPTVGRMKFWDALPRSLSLMTGLKELAYRAIWSNTSTSGHSTRPRCVFPRVKKLDQPFPFQLDTFIWNADLRPDRFKLFNDKLIEDTVQFLQSQTRLRHLQWSDFTETCSGIPFKSLRLPNLKVLEGNYHFIQALVQNHPTITEVYWRECLREDAPFYYPIHIDAKIDIFSHIWGMSLLENVHRYLWYMPSFALRELSKKLEVLELCQDDLRITGPLFVVFFSSGILQSLKRLCIRSPYHSNVTNQDISITLTFLNSQLTPSLSYLDIWIGGDSYLRWVSATEPPVRVTIPDESRLRLPKLCRLLAFREKYGDIENEDIGCVRKS